jgi:uncharacterized protein YecE (DUF72 family)
MKSKATKPRTWIGTSGYQYPEWLGSFYPDKLSKAKMLTYYSEHFSTTEVNYTFRSMPSEKTVKRWKDETPDDFRFSLKAPQRVTHFAKLRNCAEIIESFMSKVQALGPKLGPTLFQLPPKLKADVALLSDFLDATPSKIRMAFEFRHESWFVDDTFETLRSHNAALCIADTDELSTPIIQTADFRYFRLRREDYTATDLKRWAKEVEKAPRGKRETFVYFKHEETGVGPKFGAAMSKLLER